MCTTCEGREYITLIDSELGGDGLEFSISVSAYVLYNLKSLITSQTPLSLISCSFSSSPSFPFAFLSIFLSLAYSREGHKLSSVPSQRVLQPDNPAACCPLGALGAAEGRKRRDTYVGETKWEMGRDTGCSQNRVYDQACVVHAHAHKQKVVYTSG